MTTEVTFYREHGRSAPAINVKLHVPGVEFWPASFEALPEDGYGCKPIGRTTAADLVDAAYNITAEDFWADAETMARDLGLGAIEQTGRLGGWLTLPDLADRITDDEADPDALAAYAKLRSWAEEFIADAPRKVRALALTLARYEVGASAAHRTFPDRVPA